MAVKFPFPFSSFDRDGRRVAPDPWTLVDLTMQRTSYTLRSRPSWWIEYKDPKVRNAWEAELFRQEKRAYDDERLSYSEIEYILDELAGYDKMRDKGTGIQQSCFAGVYESDSLIPEELRQRLAQAVKALEDVPEEQKNWRPGSDNQVLDLVDPSLYCGVYGRTLAYPLKKRSAVEEPNDLVQFSLETHGVHVRECAEWAVSNRFTWIPTDFDIAENGESAKALGYINNIYPTHHADFYKTIEEFVARFSFLWNRVLTDLHPSNPMPYRIDESYSWEEDSDYAPQEADYEDYYDWRCEMKDWRKDRTLILPMVPIEGYTEDISQRRVHYSIQGRRIQVFVKIFHIQLTPENPSYPGESWHVEGMANERIVACGTYCYESENTSETKMSFRAAVQECRFVDNLYEGEWGLGETYGLVSGDRGMQVLGSVQTPSGRSVAFPNNYQHKVSPFKLLDDSKPGHRRIIALFLVDPEFSIPSTSHIPPQQSTWAREAMSTPDTLFAKMPMEILDMVEGAAQTEGLLLSPEESKEFRLKLTEERTACVKDQDRHYFEAKLNFDGNAES